MREKRLHSGERRRAREVRSERTELPATWEERRGEERRGAERR